MNWQSDLNDLLTNRTKIPPNNKKCESDNYAMHTHQCPAEPHPTRKSLTTLPLPPSNLDAAVEKSETVKCYTAGRPPAYT